MPFVPVPAESELSPEAAALAREARAARGDLGPLDLALLSNPAIYRAYAPWFDVRDALESLVGERAVTLLSLAIARAVPAPYCVDVFEGALRDAGDDPDAPQVTEAEALLLDWGRAVGADPAAIPAEVVARMEQTFRPATRVVLAGYAGLMTAVAAFTLLADLPRPSGA